MPSPATIDTAKRSLVWEALANLFVGRELRVHDFEGIAQVLERSGFADHELEAILVDEVAPVFSANLSGLAVPVMEGWSRERVCAAVRDRLDTQPTLFERLLPKRWLVERRLQRVADRWRIVRQLVSEQRLQSTA